MKKIIVCDAILDIGVDILRNANDVELIEAAKIPKDKLLTMLEDVDIAITRSSTDVDEKFLDAAKNLKAVVRAGVGVDNVDIAYASKKGVIVMNVPTANTIAAVELTMTHLLTSARSFVNSHNQLKQERKWDREKWYGVELKGKTLGVIGFGHIGSRVAIRAKSFGMNILVYDPYIPASKAVDLDMQYTQNLDDVLTKSDFITIHTPKTKETNAMIGEKEIYSLTEDQKQRLLLARFSARQNSDYSRISVNFTDYVTGRPVASCYGAYALGFDESGDLDGAMVKVSEEINKLF